MVNLKIKFCGVSFSNPLILPAGIITEIPEHIRVVQAGVGGITTKSLTVEPREGNPQPRIIKFEQGILNSVGLRNPGVIKGVEQIAQLLKKTNVPIIVSLFATNIKDFQKLISATVPLKPSFIELNLSCPNVTSEFGRPLGMGKEGTFKVVKTAKKITGKIPVIAKLTPNVPDISEIAKACEEAGADAISAINSLGPGMVIDIKNKKPVLGNKSGGVTGPAIKPVAVRCVYDIYEAVKIPIIGMGGVSSWEDTIEMMMAGGTLVGVGSAMYLKGIGIYKEINKGLIKYLRKNKYHSLKEIVGLAHAY